ncbi:MAG: hypothetical protein QM770_05195 [Tepidisphaeraceae bacterium]
MAEGDVRRFNHRPTEREFHQVDRCRISAAVFQHAQLRHHLPERSTHGRRPPLFDLMNLRQPRSRIWTGASSDGRNLLANRRSLFNLRDGIRSAFRFCKPKQKGVDISSPRRNPAFSTRQRGRAGAAEGIENEVIATAVPIKQIVHEVNGVRRGKPKPTMASQYVVPFESEMIGPAEFNR